MRTPVFFFALLVGCSNGDKTDGGTEAGADAGGDTGPGGPKLTGVVSAYNSGPLGMSVVTVTGGASATTGDDGVYSLNVQKGTPFYLTVTNGDQYVKLLEQEAIMMGDATKDETLVRISTQTALKAFLPGYDDKKAALIVGVTKVATCASSEGAIVDLEPAQAGSARAYTQGGLPAPMRTYAADDQRIFFYNIDPKANVKIKLSWAMPDDSGAMQPAKPCTMVAYPTTDPTQPNLTYTGNVVLEAGDAISYERLYLK